MLKHRILSMALLAVLSAPSFAQQALPEVQLEQQQAQAEVQLLEVQLQQQMQITADDPLVAIPADEIVGSEVINERGETVGEIVDLVMEKGGGEQLFAVLEIGGFLGIGSIAVVVPMNEFQVVEGNQILLAVAHEEELSRFPKYDGARYQTAQQQHQEQAGYQQQDQTGQREDEQQAAEQTDGMPSEEQPQQQAQSGGQQQAEVTAEQQAEVTAEQQAEVTAEQQEPQINLQPAAQGDQQDQQQQAEAGQQQSEEDAIREAYWNSWLERGGNLVAEDAVEPRKIYKFVIDLSAYDYSKLPRGAGESAPVGSSLGRLLEEATSVYLVIRPVLFNATLINRKDLRPMQVSVERLRESKRAEQEAFLVELHDGEISLPSFAEQVQAGALSFEILTKEDGCATLALSVWDESGTIPLDHLIRRIRVGENTDCGAGVEMAQGLSSGMGTLLETRSGPGPVHAALHIFEVEDIGAPKSSIAVFVDAAALLADSAAESTADPAKTPTGTAGTAAAAERVRTHLDPGVYAWVLRTPLSDYIATTLPAQLEKARSLAADNGKDPYSVVAAGLADQLFVAQRDDPAQKNAAHAALAALQRIVKEKDDPVILARLVSTNGDQLYLPLGLLAARMPEPILARSPTVVQPLPREVYAHDETCVEPWTFGIPTKLDKVDDAYLADVKADPSVGSWLRNVGELVAYFGEEGRKTGKPGEGLVLLAHHERGDLWFTDRASPARPQHIDRHYPPGSVAVLAACTTAGVEHDNRIILADLNDLGIDAMIASPFAVRATYGTRLAVEFSKVIQENMSKPTDPMPTVSGLLRSASQRTADYFVDEDMAFDEMALEFEVLGDHRIRLCAPGEVEP